VRRKIASHRRIAGFFPGTKAILDELRRMNASIARKAAPPSSPWYERFYGVVLKITKYVGIPGLVIASIGPVQKLSHDAIDYYNKRHIQETYLNYATVLLSEHAIDRASRLLTTLETQKDFDPKLQYYKAKTLIAMAIQQGRNYDEAFDTANILTRIQETANWFFPSFGGVNELLELRMAIVDIDIAQQRYTDAKAEITSLQSNKKFSESSLFASNRDYRLGALDVLQFRLDDAKENLRSARAGAERTRQNALSANATFQLAKAHQFAYEHAEALELYEAAERSYQEINEQFGLLRTYNNIAMIHFDRGQDENARKYYNLQQSLARKLGDQLGYARATANIALIEKRQSNYDGAIRLALEALGVFKQQANLLGISSVAVTLSNSYDAIGNAPEAVAYAKQALATGIQLRDLRAVGTACGSLANVYNRSHDKEEGVFSSLCAAAIIKYLKNDNLPGPSRDYGIFVSAIRRVRDAVDPAEYARILAAAEKRVGEIIISLNLEKTMLADEIKKLRS
jgi:tetratricopeptide (TPR) repeat protein